MILTSILKYNEAIEAIKNDFLQKYYDSNKVEDINHFWVSNKTGGLLSVGNECFDLLEMVTALENNISKSVLMDWHEKSLLEVEAGNDPIDLLTFFHTNE